MTDLSEDQGKKTLDPRELDAEIHPMDMPALWAWWREEEDKRKEHCPTCGTLVNKEKLR